MADRTYWHAPGSRSWHALAGYLEDFGPLPVVRAACGRVTGVAFDTADRVPPNAHLCGSCARVIAARTDVEAA